MTPSEGGVKSNHHFNMHRYRIVPQSDERTGHRCSQKTFLTASMTRWYPFPTSSHLSIKSFILPGYEFVKAESIGSLKQQKYTDGSNFVQKSKKWKIYILTRVDSSYKCLWVNFSLFSCFLLCTQIYNVWSFSERFLIFSSKSSPSLL